MAAREWSPQQAAVFAFVEDPARKHGVVEALAGSGKTTTIVEALKHTTEGESVLMVAFNKAIATELASRAPNDVDVLTLHSFGLRAITRAMGRRKIDSWCTANQLQELMGRDRNSLEARRAVEKLISLGKGCLAQGTTELDEIADEYAIDFPKGWDRGRLVALADKVMHADAEAKGGPISFDDMIWLPIVRDLPLPEYDWVFVDETQDLNAAQLEIVIRAAGEQGRIVAVGDRRQAIYGFRGANSNAIPEMITRLEAHVMPLSVTYRCPQLVVAEANELVPSLEAAPSAPCGVVREATEEILFRDAAPGDFVISRTNAPLVSLCFRWLAAGRKATIKGRDIGQGLIAWVKGTHATTVRELERAREQWHTAEAERLIAKERDTSAVDDKSDCLEALIAGCATVEAVIAKIERLFSDGDERGSILLTSTHRSKGLEADRVWLLRDTYCKRTGTEEENLLYVAITRSKRELIYVSADAEVTTVAAE